jgi:hypothetical protein
MAFTFEKLTIYQNAISYADRIFAMTETFSSGLRLSVRPIESDFRFHFGQWCIPSRWVYRGWFMYFNARFA